MSLGAYGYVFAGLAGFAAGGVNALAGGGTLITFPVLVGVGLSPIRANVTNLIALTPGYASGTIAQREDLSGQGRHVRALLPVAAAGGLLGSIVLVLTSAHAFKVAVPFLIVMSCTLLVAQGKVRAFVSRREAILAKDRHGERPTALMLAGVFLSAVYGGYFGAGLGIMLLAVLGLFSEERLPRLNAVKQALSFVISLVASLFLAFSSHVSWGFVAVIVPTSILGAFVGGKVVRVVHPSVLRVVVVGVGLAVAIRYWV